MIRKTTLAVLGLAASGFVSAGMYAPPSAPACVPGHVTVPCEANMWDLGIQALYLKSVFDANRAYALTDFQSNDFRELKNTWDFGFRLEGSYHFGTGSDISMNWSHIDADNNHAGIYAGRYNVSGVGIFNGNAAVSTTDKFDQVNLVMGQHVDVGMMKNARFYGGLQYAKIQAGAQAVYTINPAFLPDTGGIQSFDDIDFNGVGPVIGLDYAYNVANGFSITASTAAAILYGTSRQNTGYVYGVGAIVTPTYSIHKVLVPELEAKLGANYAWQMAQGTLNLQAGYQVLNYFSALHGDARPGMTAGTPTASDYGLYGPYFGVKWVGMA